MNVLDGPHLNDCARRAGFQGDDLAVAIATAWATSGGVISYDHRCDPGPLARYEGLWGIDTVRWPEWADTLAGNPHRAAEAAYDLTTRSNGFGWCPAYVAGAHVPHLAAAAVATTTWPGQGNEPSVVHSEIARRRLASIHAHGLGRVGTIRIGRH